MAKGLIKNFTGIDAPYEAPLKPELLLKNSELSVNACVDKLVAVLTQVRGLHIYIIYIYIYKIT